MYEYDIELSGSVTVKKTATGHAELRKATRYALGRISVVCHDREVVYGSALDVYNAICTCEEHGYALGDWIG